MAELKSRHAVKDLLRLCSKAIHELRAIFVSLLGHKCHADFASQSPGELTLFTDNLVAGNEKVEFIGNLDIRNKQPSTERRNVGNRALAWEPASNCLKLCKPINGMALMFASVTEHGNNPVFSKDRKRIS